MRERRPDAFMHACALQTHADTRLSAIGFVIASLIFLPWLLLYMIAGESVLSYNVWYTLDATRLDTAALGLPTS